MITRIKINGFKSLVDTDLYLGPFTCIAGANAIGKSNFFDALVFLSHLADDTILQAVKAVRSENQKHSNVRDIFFRNGSEYLKEMSFEIDMIIPKISEDDLGQVANATITSLKYCLKLRLNEDIDGEVVEIVSEELKPLTQTETRKNIYFDYDKDWLNSVLYGRRSTRVPFISVDDDKIKLHQDGSKGRTTDFIAKKMPRTLLSTVTAESPTAFLARQEIRNWTMLQFEPSALRQPNSVYEVKNAEITANGLNLPATLYRLHSDKKDRDIYQILTNKLKGLVEDVNEITIDKDEKRDLLTLQIGFKGGLILPAQSLSDGTLRFLGLAIIEEDSMSSGLICLEEPENGINPKKVLEMVNLLKGMATDTDYSVDENNPLRQVIINTHSPIVVSAVPDESLYLAKGKESFIPLFNKKIKSTGFSALKDTWKTKQNLADETTYGEISAYLDDESPNQIIEEPTIVYTKKQRTVSQNINSQYTLF